MQVTDTTYTLSFAAVPTEVRSEVTDIIETLSEAGPIGWLVLHTEESDLVIAEDGVAVDSESYRLVARLTDKFPLGSELAISQPITEEKVMELLAQAREILSPMESEPSLGMQVKRARAEGDTKAAPRKATVPTGKAPAQKPASNPVAAGTTAANPAALAPTATIQPGWSWSMQLTPAVSFAPKSFVPQQPAHQPESGVNEEVAVAEQLNTMVEEPLDEAIEAVEELAEAPEAQDPPEAEPVAASETTADETSAAPRVDSLLSDPWAETALVLYSVMQNGSPAIAEISIAGTDIVQVDFRYRAFNTDVPIEHLPCAPGRVAIHVVEAQPDWPPAFLLPAQSLDKLLWYIGTNAFEGASAPWLRAEDSYRLQRWPNFAAMGYSIDHLRMTALIGNDFFTADELARAAGMPRETVNRLLNAYSLMNLLQIMPPQPAALAPEAPPALPEVAPQPGGLVPWLRARLGI